MQDMANLKMAIAYILRFNPKIAWTDRNMIAYYFYELVQQQISNKRQFSQTSLK